MSRVGPDFSSPKLPTGAGHRLDHLPGPLGETGQQICSRWWIFVLKT